MSFEDKFHWLLGAYIASPQWVKSSIGKAYSAIPMSLRVGRTYDQWRTLAKVNEPQQIETLVREKMWQTLRTALTHVPHFKPWQHLLQQERDCFALLRQLPLTSKEMIKQDGKAFLAENRKKRDLLTMFTGGSTATPMRFYIEKGVTRTREYAFIDEFQAQVGLEPDDVVLALRGRNVPTAKDGTRFWMYEPIKRQLILSSDHMQRNNMADYIEAMREWKPRFISSYASTLLPLAKWLEISPAPDVVDNIKGILLFSENVLEHQEALFRRVFRCPVVKHYGHSERAVFAASSVDDARYRVSPQYGFCELVDIDSGELLTRAGQVGEIVSTSFDNHVMPFVRYQTGDLAVLAEDIDPARPWLVMLEKIEGCTQDLVLTKDHRMISVTSLGAAHFDELESFRGIKYEQIRPGELIMWVEADEPISDSSKEKICHALWEKTQGGCTLEVRQTEKLDRTIRGKLRILKQHLDLEQFKTY